MASVMGSSILGGILGGMGGAMTGLGKSWGEQQKLDQEERLARDKMAQEQQYRDALVTLERDKLAQTAMPAGDLFRYIGMPVPEGVDPAARVPTAVADNLIKNAQEQQKVLQTEGRLNMAREAILNQPARPDVAMPAEGAMYSEAETLPGKAATPKNVMLAAVLGQPNADALLKQMYPEPANPQVVGPGADLVAAGGAVLHSTPALPKDPKDVQLKVEIVDRPEGTYQVITNPVTGETQTAKLEGVPGKPAFAPQRPERPEQPSASALYMRTMQQYQAARNAYGEEDQRTKDLAAIALGLRSQVDPTTGARTAPPEKSDPIKDLVKDALANKNPPPAPGASPPSRPRPAPTAPPAAVPPPPGPRPAPTAAPAAVPRPPFPGAIRIQHQSGWAGWIRPGEAMPAGAQAVP